MSSSVPTDPTADARGDRLGNDESVAAPSDGRANRGRPRLVQLSRRGRPRKIRPAALHGVLLTQLRDMIQNGELAPGERIVEKDLSEQFGISRTPLREALKVLSSEGLVKLRPHRTPQVAPVDPDEIAAIFEILEALEGLAARRARENMSAAQLAELEALHAAMMAEHDVENRVAYAMINRNIHSRIVEMAGNRELTALHTALGIKIQRARMTANYDERRWSESDREHEQIMQAFRSGSPQRCAEIMTEHARRTGEAVIATLRRIGGDRIKAAE
jgi:DNA-binding GntR family transcriptional regulator